MNLLKFHCKNKQNTKKEFREIMYEINTFFLYKLTIDASEAFFFLSNVKENYYTKKCSFNLKVFTSI